MLAECKELIEALQACHAGTFIGQGTETFPTKLHIRRHVEEIYRRM
jgi:hypothetical protein